MLRLGEMEVLVSNLNQLFSGAKYNKGKLVLFPLGTLQLVPNEKVIKNQVVIKCSDFQHKVFVVTAARVDFSKATGFFCPFWFIKEGLTDEKDECIMQRQLLKHENLHIPVFVNKKQVDKNYPLLLEPEADPKQKKQKTQK